MVTAYLYLRLYLYLCPYLYLCFTIRISVLALALQFVVACVFLSKPTPLHLSVELYFSQPDFVFVTGPLICISHELTLYFSPKFLISQSGISPGPAAGFAFSKGQNPSELNFQNHQHIVWSWNSFVAVLVPIQCLKMALEGSKEPGYWIYKPAAAFPDLLLYLRVREWRRLEHPPVDFFNGKSAQLSAFYVRLMLGTVWVG